MSLFAAPTYRQISGFVKHSRASRGAKLTLSQQSEIATKVGELSGVHKYDLTPDVTHLIVGDYDTPKYRHVARERPDIKAMDAAWIEAVSELWRNDDDVDFAALEKQHELKPLEKCGTDLSSPGGGAAGRQSLLICLTGFGEQREEITNRITANGGRYTGDLTRRCTHLVVSKPEGKKFTAAKSWGVHTVTLGWLDMSLQRGMILDEAKFDPLMPEEEQGVDAWIRNPKRSSLGKRSRSSASNSTEDRGARKLRKTASMKLNSQRSNLWGDILGRPDSQAHSFAHEQPRAHMPVDNGPAPEPTLQEPPRGGDAAGVFANAVFSIHGFGAKRSTVLRDTIATLGGAIASTLEVAATRPAPCEPFYRFLVVPQTSQPDTHPNMEHDNLLIVTEFYIEKCLHSKQFFHPDEHVLGRPFPLFPIPGLKGLVVCSAAFTGLELNQVARSVNQIGAVFDEEFRKTTSVVVCKSLKAMRKDKLKYALEWGVPVVSADWLWECISTGYNVPIQKYIFSELKSRYAGRLRTSSSSSDKGQTSEDAKAKPGTAKLSASRPRIIGGFDASAFDKDSSPEKSDAAKPSANFLTARTHPVDTFTKGDEAPLTEVSSARLNKSPSPSKQHAPPLRTKSDPFPKSLPEATKHSHGSEPSETTTSTTSKTTSDSDDAKMQVKAAERQALATKLNSLMDSAASLDEPDARTQAPPRNRRRQLLGRAISNVSNASSASNVADSLRAAAAAMSGAAEDDDESQAEQPPATQLEYVDRDAQKIKAELMSKMMGGSAQDTTIIGGRALRKRD